MDLDIERLHDLVSGEIVGEKIGNTTAKIEEIISCIQLEQCKHIIVVVNYYHSIRTAKQQVVSAAFFSQMIVGWDKATEICLNSVVVRFKMKDEPLSGYDDYYLVEMDY